jgi:hypothetical protein
MLKSFKKTFKIIMCGLMGIILSLGLFSPGLQVLANETNPYDDSSQMNILNKMEEAGYLVVDNVNETITITEKYKQYVLENLSSDQDAIFTENSVTIVPKIQTRANKGVNKFVWTWKGFDIYIDNNICNMVVQGTPVAAALAAFIPDPTVTKVVAVALAAAAGLIGYNNHGRGVIIAFAWIPGKTPVPHWISSQ